VTNTSRVVEEDMQYLDEEPEIIAVVPATGWAAAVGEKLVPLVAFVALDSAKLYGVAVGNDGLVDLEDNIEDAVDFNGYHQATNEPKENQ
jgi:hypothetical protein